MWIDVERVVIACDLDESISTEQRRSLCRQIAAEARRLTNYPVALATRADLEPSPERLQVQSHQLILHIEGRLSGDQLLMSVRPERRGLNAWRGAVTPIMPVRLSGATPTAVLQRPMAPLALLLSEPEQDRRLPIPPRSDRQ